MKKIVKKVTFVGRPFTDHMIDEQKSFNACNIKVEQDSIFQQFLQENNLTNSRSSMVVFGPDNFMYWYGVNVANRVKVPQSLMKFELPKAEVAVEEKKNQNVSFFGQPLNLAVSEFLQKVRAKGIPTYENLGDSMTPYIVQDLNLATKELTQMLYLEVSK